MTDNENSSPQEFHLYLILPFLHSGRCIVEHSALARYYPNENEAFGKIHCAFEKTFAENYRSSQLRNFNPKNECEPSSSMQFRLNHATRLRSESLSRLDVTSDTMFPLSRDSDAFLRDYIVNDSFIESILGENARILLERVQLRFHELGVSILTGLVRVKLNQETTSVSQGEFRGLLEDILQRAFYHLELRKWVADRCHDMDCALNGLDKLRMESVIQQDFKMLKSKGPFRYGHVVTIFQRDNVDGSFDPLDGVKLGGVDFTGRAHEFLYQVDMSTVENACPPTEGFVYVGHNRSLIVHREGLGCIDNIGLAIPNTVVGAVLSCIRRLIVDWMTAGTLHELLIRKLQLYAVTLSQQDESRLGLLRDYGGCCSNRCGTRERPLDASTSTQTATNGTSSGLTSSSATPVSLSNGIANDPHRSPTSAPKMPFFERLCHCFTRSKSESSRTKTKNMSEILDEIEWMVLEVELYQSTMSLYRSMMMPITSRAYRMVHENLWRLKDSEASYERSLRALKTLYVEANAKMDRRNQKQQNRSVFILTILFLVPTVEIFYDLFAPKSEDNDAAKGGWVIGSTVVLAFLAWFVSGFGLK